MLSFLMIGALLLLEYGWYSDGYRWGMNRLNVQWGRIHHISMSPQDNKEVSVSTVQQSLTKNIRTNVIKSVALSSVMAKLLLRSPSSSKAEEIAQSLKPFLSLDCDDGIIVLQQPNTGRVIVMIGTAHISEESVNVVRRTIQRAQPDTVMIELDPKRIARADVNSEQLQAAGFILPQGATFPTADSNTAPLAPPKRKSLFDDIKRGLVAPVQQLAQSVAGAALGKVIGQFYKSVEKLGFTSGGEFKAAVEEGKKLQAKILLGDRDVDITLQRLATAVAQTNPDKLSETFSSFEKIEKNLGIDTASIGEDVTKEELGKFVESIKQKQFIIQLMNVLKQELPDVYSALVGERDEYMANSILGTNSSKVLVGVVGLAHLAGIEANLKNKGGFKSIQRNCPSLQL